MGRDAKDSDTKSEKATGGYPCIWPECLEICEDYHDAERHEDIAPKTLFIHGPTNVGEKIE